MFVNQKMIPFGKLNGKQLQFIERLSWLTNLTGPELGTAQPQLVFLLFWMDRTATIFHQSSSRQVRGFTIGLEFDNIYVLIPAQKPWCQF